MYPNLHLELVSLTYADLKVTQRARAAPVSSQEGIVATAVISAIISSLILGLKVAARIQSRPDSLGVEIAVMNLKEVIILCSCPLLQENIRLSFGV